MLHKILSSGRIPIPSPKSSSNGLKIASVGGTLATKEAGHLHPVAEGVAFRRSSPQHLPQKAEREDHTRVLRTEKGWDDGR